MSQSNKDEGKADQAEIEAFKLMAEASSRRGVTQSRGGLKTEALRPRLHSCFIHLAIGSQWWSCSKDVTWSYTRAPATSPTDEFRNWLQWSDVTSWQTCEYYVTIVQPRVHRLLTLLRSSGLPSSLLRWLPLLEDFLECGECWRSSSDPSSNCWLLALSSHLFSDIIHVWNDSLPSWIGVILTAVFFAHCTGAVNSTSLSSSSFI